MIKISKRLKVIADLVEDGSSIVDIGCDHGLLDVYLMQSKKHLKVIASDVNEKALANAIKNINKYKLENKIETVISNGLDNININSIDTIVISGMGTHTIAGILYNNIKKLKRVDTLIIQSNNDLDFLRYKVNKLGYKITEEILVSDAGIIYTVIKFKKGWAFYTKKQLYFGPILMKEMDELFWDKNKQELEKLKKFYPMIPKRHWHHRKSVKWKIKRIEEVLNNY